MDMAPATTNSTTTTTTIVGLLPIKVPEAGSETPPRIQPSKPFSFSNGVLKRHTAQYNLVGGGGVTYKECLKNHAANLGGHALDGCGEFMPAPTATAVDPTSLKCAACGCHRNFHRQELEEVTGGIATQVIEYHPHHRHHPLPPSRTHHHSAPHKAVAACQVQSPGSDNHSPPPISSSYYPGSAPHMLLALSSGGAGVVIDNNNNNNNIPLLNNSPNFPSRKRFRTKFSQEQKEKMQEFAEKVGWKMQKSNEEMVNGFCNEIGVERGVFKVWMHNNKNSFTKRSATSTTLPAINYGISATNQATNEISNEAEDDDEHGNGNGVVGNSNSHSSSININIHHQQFNGRSSHENNAPTNGSSSSS